MRERRKKLVYVPLEPYPERYTCQLSRAEDGWLERNWKKAGIDYIRVEGKSISSTIQHGSVLDACGRGYWAASQVMELLHLVQLGKMDENTVVYFDDFWHPGIEALPYAFELVFGHDRGRWPKLYAMLHAQSVDPNDFTYPMRDWMRHYEVGQGKFMSGIFVTSTCLRDMLLHAGIGTPETVVLAGLPYCSEEVKEHFPERLPKKKAQVVFSSRWDREKRPEFFLNVVMDIVLWRKRRDIKFVITTSAPRLRSNEPGLLAYLHEVKRLLPEGTLEVRENQSKDDYYRTLLESAVQFNCADQDFVSWTLLEATTCGCVPVYPYWLSFPEALMHTASLMYPKGDIQGAADKVLYWIDRRDEAAGVGKWDWVYWPFDLSWKRMAKHMGLIDEAVPALYE